MSYYCSRCNTQYRESESCNCAPNPSPRKVATVSEMVTKEACAEYIETLATFFVCHATGPGERAYTVGEIGDMIREWTASLRGAEWRGNYLAPAASTLGVNKP